MAGLALFYTMADADGEEGGSRVTIPIDPTNFTFANAAGVIENAWDILNPLMNGTLLSAGFSYEVDIGTFTNAAAATIADVQEKAEFAFRSVEGLIKRLSLPTFIETFLLGGGSQKNVDLSATEVAAFTTMMTSSTGIPNPDDVDNPVRPVDIHGDFLTTTKSAHQSWGRNRR